MNLRRVRRGVAGVAVFLAVLETLGRTGLIDPLLLPLASTVTVRAAGLVIDPSFLSGTGHTLLACGGGLLLAVAIAVPAGLLLGTVPVAESTLRPLIEFLRPIPSVALIPLALFLFTDGAQAKVALIVFAASWPLLINTMYGLREVDPVAKDTLRSFGFGPLAVVVRVALPSAAPFVVTGVRIASSVALIVAVSVELVAGGTGIGTFLSDAAAGNQREVMLAAVVWTGVIGLAVNTLLVAAERRLFRWHGAGAGESG
ncbi:ABC transporter permease [Streptosporangium sp. CA-135522]|uniref:ABC transporter permease n=1 Tax=Streptosporangium sp. CA-135522 TaxID=3240072 RepID=UPI003D89DBEE